MSAVLGSILELIAAKDFYTAHQKTRTSATRLLVPRNGPVPTTYDKKAQNAVSLLFEVSKKLLEESQAGSGVDLAQMMVDVWKSRNVVCGDDERAKICQIITLIGPVADWRKTFTDFVFARSAKTGSGPFGDAAIHAYFGQVLLKEQDYVNAAAHLIHSTTADASRNLADVLFAWAQSDPDGVGAFGRYAGRGTLSYLVAGAILPARTFISTFVSMTVSAYPEILVSKSPYPTTGSPLSKTHATASTEELFITKLPSLNFLQLAVWTCMAGEGASFEKIKNPDGVLREVKGTGRSTWVNIVAHYEKEVNWMRTDDVKVCLQEIGTIYFNMAPPRPVGNPMLQMLGSMFGGQ